MSCSCKDNTEAIIAEKRTISELRALFIKRMTVDSDTTDSRRKEFNQAIFGYDYDLSEENKTPENTYQVFNDMSMDMVLRCFDDAAADLRSTWCDVKTCRRKP